MATVRKGARRSKRAQYMREGFEGSQKIAGELADLGSKLAANQQTKRQGLQKLKRQAYDSNEMADRIAELKKTGGK